MRIRHLGGSLLVTAVLVALVPRVAAADPAAAADPPAPGGCSDLTVPEENHASIRLQVDRPAAGAEVAVDEQGRIAVDGILHKQATMLDVSDEDITSSTFTLGSPPAGVAAWASSWTTALRPPHLGANELCARAERDPKRTARIKRSFTVVDLIPPTAVTDLAVGGITATTAKVTWGAATDNYGLAGYEITIDGGPARRTDVGTRSYTITGLAPSTGHTVSVVAVDLAGNRSTPSTASFTTAAATPPPGGDFTFEPEQGAATVVWHPTFPTDATYRISLDDHQLEEVPVDLYCQDANGNPANPCTPQAVIRYPLSHLDENTPYSFRVDALKADGTLGRSLTGSFTTTVGPDVVPPELTQFVASESARCAGVGGDFYVSPTARAGLNLPAGSTPKFDGCFTVPNSSCLDAFLPPSGNKVINCADDLTGLLRSLAPPGRGPVISSLDGVVDYAAPPGQRVALQQLTWCTNGACALLFAPPAELEQLAERALQIARVAGPSAASISWVAVIGGGIALGLALFVLYEILFPTQAGINGVFEYPIHFDTNFETFDNWGLSKGAYVNSLKLYSEVIKTTTQLADRHDLPFAWTSDEDQDFKRSVDLACGAQSGRPSGSGGVCGDGFAVYVPGALNYRFRPMPETGAHIVRAMGDGGPPRPPTRGVWFYPGRSVGGQRALSAGYTRGWFDRFPFVPNTCTGRGAIRPVCDEFPFWSTDQAVNLSGQVASLQPVPLSEASPQGNDIAQFYNQCKVKDTDRFVVLPVKPWVQALGPSFGFRVSPGGTSLCLTPRP